MLTATDTLVSLRDSAVALKDRADSFIAELDSAIAASPKDLGAVIDALKDEVLNGLADSVRAKPSTPAASTDVSFKCPYCDKQAKNDLGLSIHVGRFHPEKSKKGKREAANRRKAARKAPETSATNDVPTTVPDESTASTQV